MSDTVVEIGSRTYGEFEDCKQLKNIKLSKNLESIYTEAFKGCTSLESVTIPAKVQSIGNYAFEDCDSLETLIFEEGISTINASAFNNYPGYTGNERLYNITIPKSVASIEGNFVKIHPNATFHVEKGSYADQYANENGYKVEYIK